MPWTIEYLPEEKTVLIVSRGEIAVKDSAEQTEAAIGLQAEHDVSRFLLDFSEAHVMAPLAEIYHLPDYYSKRGVPRHIRIAVVVPPKHHQADKFQFYETVCLNRGYNSKLFTSTEDAWAWLKKNSVKK